MVDMVQLVNKIVGVLLEMPDPQREGVVIDSNNYDLIYHFTQTLQRYDYKAVILHNNLSKEFVQTHSSAYLSFVRVVPDLNYNVYINKFIVVQRYLEVVRFDKVLISDLTDVVFLKAGLFDWFKEGVIYSGSENDKLSSPWIRENSLTLRNGNKDFDDWWLGNKDALQLLNCGLIAGWYNSLKQELFDLVKTLMLYAKGTNEIAEMFTWNMIAYRSGKKIITNEPFNTEFKKYDKLNTNCYVAHK